MTVLATGFGMKDIPDMRPVIEKDEIVKQELTRAEQEKIEKENKKLDSMLEAFYKPDFKVYVFKGDDMNNEELLAALDNSPTYTRTAQELERITAIAEQAVAEPCINIEESADVEECDETENNEQ